MVDFILSYWRLILIILLIVANLLVSIFKRPKVVNTIIDAINGYIPTAINEAERVLGANTGAQKLNYVVNMVIDYLSYRFNLSLNILKRYEAYIIREVEVILSTPQKKKEGDVNG